MRYARAYGARDWAQLERYLPSNYQVHAEHDDGHFLIRGSDRAGWTLDGYVIPRLASGLIRAEEVATDGS